MAITNRGSVRLFNNNGGGIHTSAPSDLTGNRLVRMEDLIDFPDRFGQSSRPTPVLTSTATAWSTVRI